MGFGDSVSALGAHEEHDQNPGAGMGADDGAYIAGGDLLDLVLFPEQSFQGSSVFGAVAVTDEHGVERLSLTVHLRHRCWRRTSAQRNS